MNKPLVIIILLTIIYLLTMALSPNAQKVHGKFAKLEYGFVSGPSVECNQAQSSKPLSGPTLHYFVQKDGNKTKIEYFCFDDAKYAANLHR